MGETEWVIDHGAPTAPAAAGSSDELRTVLAASGIGTFWWDAPSGVVHWDPTLERLAGLEPGQFGGTYDAWLATLHPEETDTILEAVGAAIAAMGSYHFEHRVTWLDGTERWLECRGQTIAGADGEFLGTVGCAIDVTERQVVGRQRTEALQRERRLRDRMEFLVRLSHGALSSDVATSMQVAVDSAVPQLGEWCSIHYLPEDRSQPLVAVAHSDPAKVDRARALVESTPFDADATWGIPAVIRSGRTELVEQVSPSVIEAAAGRSGLDAAQREDLLADFRPVSVMTVPLVTKRGALGAMQFLSTDPGRRYDGEDIALAEIAAAQVAKALDNLWLTEQSRNVSATLQRALLPPRLPTIPGIDLAVGYWPAGVAVEAGGDFYDVFELSPTSWSVVIGDVCGRGPDAAALTGIARHTARAAARHGQQHRDVLEWVNEAMRLSNRDRFCTSVYATLDRSDDGWTFTSCAAGHPRPVLLRAHGRAELLGPPGTLLGVFPDITVQPVETRLQPGDVVVLYTDGVTDLPPPHGRTEADVVELISRLSSKSSDEIASAIRSSVADQVGDGQMDDVALVVLRVTDDV